MSVMTETMVDTAGTDFDFAPRLSPAIRPGAGTIARMHGVPVLDVVIPVYNEQVALAGSVRRLHRYLEDNFPYSARITIADNASIDDTPYIGAALAEELPGVRFVRMEQKGRGRALNAVWSASDSPV